MGEEDEDEDDEDFNDEGSQEESSEDSRYVCREKNVLVVTVVVIAVLTLVQVLC